jgi:hypothetical protein
MARRGEKTAHYETLVLAIVLALGAAFLVSFARGLGARTEMPAEDVRPDADAPANLDERRVGRVEVLNGTRVAGFDVVHFGNADGIDADSSVVYSRISNDEIAKAAAAALGITRVVLQPDTSRYVDASVVLGADWRPVNSTRAR